MLEIARSASGPAIPSRTGRSTGAAGTGEAIAWLAILGGLGLSFVGFLGPGTNWLLAAGGAVVAVIGFSLRDRAASNRSGATSPEERELFAASNRWTSAVLIRRYKNDNAGIQKANAEANLLAQHGYSPAGQSASGSHVNVGRTATGAVLTGGISLLFGGSRSKGSIQITFTR